LEKTGELPEDMKAKGIYPIHPSFRIVALADPPVTGSATQQWITPSNTAKLPSNAAITKGDNRHVVSPLGKVCRCCRRSRDVISWYNIIGST
jgi:hypothetical protein